MLHGVSSQQSWFITGELGVPRDVKDTWWKFHYITFATLFTLLLMFISESFRLEENRKLWSSAENEPKFRTNTLLKTKPSPLSLNEILPSKTGVANL